MAVPQNTPFNEVVVHFPQKADVSTAGSVRAACPVKGKLVRAYSIIGGAITVADGTWSVQVNDVNVTGTATIAVSGSAAGVVDSVVLSGPNVGVNPGDTLEIVNNGESTDTQTVDFSVVIRT
jgi:hypothetical protein